MRTPSAALLTDGNWFGAILAVAVSACGPGVPPVQATAAKELSCSEAKIDVEELSPALRKASGCGKENVYVYDSSKGRMEIAAGPRGVRPRLRAESAHDPVSRHE